jgi:hypothetical protein
MEEFRAIGHGPLSGPEDRATPAPETLDAGRLAGFLVALQRARFDGLLNIQSGPRSASIGFRDGAPVTFDDPTPGHTLADQLVEREQLTREQCNTILGRMTDALVDDETVAFCEHAVQLGYLTEEEANVELSSRIRARMLQLFELRDCETSLTPGTAALFERRKFPQNLGAILYIGVRTFYEEEFLSSCHPDLDHTYVHLTGAPATIAHYFGLDDEEFHLLRRIHAEQPASQLLRDRKLERVHLLALLFLLRIAGFCEVSSVPASQRQSPARRAPTNPEPIAQDTLVTPPPPPPLVEPPAPRPTAKPTVDATQEALLEAAARTARMRRSLPARRNSKQADPLPAATPTPAAESGGARRSVPDALAAPARSSVTPPQPSQAPQPQTDYAKQHLKELIARRKHTASAPEAGHAANQRDPARELREARGLLHAQQYARADKLLTSLVELEPQNELYKTYQLWARWRAQPEAANAPLGQLEELAKKLLGEKEHAAFVAYVLGHLNFHHKRDEIAEKYFKRAHAADRSNKDAERHLLILERRKQGADASSNNRKLFGIQLPSSKPKP